MTLACLIVCFEGQTAEITIYLKKSDGTLKELHRPTGGLWGSTKINEAFEQMMIEIVGSKVFEKFKNDYKHDYFDLCREFEIKKRNVTPKKVTGYVLKYRSPWLNYSRKKQGNVKGRLSIKRRMLTK